MNAGLSGSEALLAPPHRAAPGHHQVPSGGKQARGLNPRTEATGQVRREESQQDRDFRANTPPGRRSGALRLGERLPARPIP